MNHLSSSLTSMRRSPYQSLSAILMLSVTCFVGYAFSLLGLGTHQILQYFETRPQIIAFFELTTTQSQIEEQAQVLRGKSYVTEVKVITKDQALKIYQQDNKEDPLLLELVTAEILPASIEVSGRSIDDLPQINQDLKNLKGLDEVVYQQDVIDSLSRWTRGVRIAGIVMVGVLGLISFLITVIVIGMKVTARRGAIHIMRIIGATKWYITQPYFFEGVLYGLTGSLIGWTVMLIGLLYLTPWIKEFLGTISLVPVPWQVLAIQLSTGTLVSSILGGLSGIWAVRRLTTK
jgi:cell division transport system permease protein